MLKATVVLLAFVSIACAAVSRAPLEPKPEKYKNVKGCYISALGDVIPFGEIRPSKTACEGYLCQETMVQILGCGAVGVKDSCHAVYDLTKQYPECCKPTVECD